MAGWTLGDLPTLTGAAAAHPLPIRLWQSVLAGLDTGHADYTAMLDIVTGILGSWEDWFDAHSLDLDPGFNFAPLGAMSSWPGGHSSAPEGWTLSGTGGTIARGTTGGPPDGSEWAEVTRSGNDVTLRLEVPSTVRLNNRFGCRAWLQHASGSGAVSIITRVVGTEFGTLTPDNHRIQDSGEWQLIENRSLVTADATSVQVQLLVSQSNGVGKIGGVRLFPLASLSTGLLAPAAFSVGGRSDLTAEAERIASAVQGVADLRSSVKLTVNGLEIEADTGTVVES